ncbi:hypothetical protein GCM10010387_30170 [Streptomyces inusitatus]|uniref:Oxidoreductase n=1 Tax=Streptomyces inusitatus TaxID=68221 RepID=A0A918UUL1_9ACTN|nr:hypothetical protein [Streptomyces inusitatus]GGZ33926.1 hypothetical protein GCM10010387_30170 [Streptomyces inusitatus]
MSAEYATFGLAPVMRTGGVLSDGAQPAHRDFMDFIVDGRPLLLLLSDSGAVSPLAADVRPVILTDRVPALLLERPAPPGGGRCPLYGCPECRSLECGMVTAVVERAGPDVIWRDFAWQTSLHPDPDPDGYPGTGPFRFRGDLYRAALRPLTDGSATGRQPIPPEGRGLPRTEGWASRA